MGIHVVEEAVMFDLVLLDHIFQTISQIYEKHELLAVALEGVLVGAPLGIWIQSLRTANVVREAESQHKQDCVNLEWAQAQLEKERARFDGLLEYMRTDRAQERIPPIVVEKINYAEKASAKVTISEFHTFVVSFLHGRKRKKHPVSIPPPALALKR
jgi:hypothetical protein